uniref:Uncharacterized protein n=1 Tax=Anguilla anguilla TaxID=7936 RepID=A0A0E9UYL1_ANGAN
MSELMLRKAALQCFLPQGHFLFISVVYFKTSSVFLGILKL